MSTENKTRSFCRECGQVTWHTVVASVGRDEIEFEGDTACRPVYSDIFGDHAGRGFCGKPKKLFF